MIPDPTIVASSIAYSGRIFDIELHELVMANGVETKREIIRHPGAVCMVPVTAQGTLLLVTQFRLAAGRRLLELPAGTLEQGEQPIDCAARELQEEVGHAAATITPAGGFFVAPGYTSEYIHLFICTDLRVATLPGDDDEDIEVETVPLALALRHIEEGVICDAKSVIGILKYARSLGL